MIRVRVRVRVLGLEEGRGIDSTNLVQVPPVPWAFVEWNLCASARVEGPRWR
jgi:hypothetical protein